MATQGITIPIQAKIEGWQAELKRIQDEAKKINLGSSLGRDLERYLTTLEKQVNTIGKSLTQNFTSDAAIDRFGNKVGDIEERFQHIGQILGSIQLGDLNVEYVSQQLNPLIDQINLLQNQLNDELDVAWGDKISGEATKVQKAFARIGKSEDDIKNLGREGTCSVLEEMVTSAIKQADEAAEKIKNLQHNIAEFKKAEQDWQPTAFAKETNIDSYVSSVISKDPTSYGFQPIINEQALEETKKKIEDSINEIKLSDAKKADIQKYLNDLVPTSSVELIRKRIDQIKQVLSGVAGRAAFGLDAKSLDGYLNDIFNKFDPTIVDSSLDKIKERFISDGITEEDLNKFWGPFSDAIKNQDFDKAIEIVSTNLTDLQGEYKSGKDKIIAARQELEAALKQAQGDQFRAAWTRTFGEDALKELDALIEKYTAASDTAKELNKTQKELDQKTAKLVQQPQDTGRDIAYESSQRYQQLTSEIQAYKAELADVQAKEQMLGKIQGVAQRWFSIYAAVRMVENTIKTVISTITELDKTITEIAIVTDMGQEELWGQMPQYTALAQQYAASISGVYQVSQLYYQQGLDTVEVMELTEQTLKMARISGLDYAQATDYMTNAIRSFKMEMSDAQSIVDVYSAIAATSATDTTELASAMSKTASSAQAVGSSFEDTTAMMAVMIEATRESAENIGSAMKSIISRYGEMTSDPSKLVDSEGEVMSLNRVDTALQTVGITIHDTEGKFRSFSDVIVELAERWDTIDTNTQRYIATTMAGNRQQSRFLALVSSGDRLKELMTIADESEDASQLQYLKTLDSITAKTQQLQTSLQTLYTDVGIEKWYKSLLDVANNVLATFNKMPTVFNLPIAAIANFGIQFYNIASVVTTVVSMIKNDLVTQAQHVQGLITEKEKEASQERIENARAEKEAKNAIAQEEAQERADIAAGKTTAGTTKTIGLGKWKKEVSSQTYSKLSLAAKAAGTALSFVTAGMGEATATARVTKGALEGVSGALSAIGYWMSGNPFMAIVSGVMAAVNAIDTIIETSEERAERLAKAAEEANNKRIESSANYKDLKSELDQIKELEKTYNDSAEAKKEYYEHTNAIAEQYPVLVSAYDTEGNAILDLAKAYDVLHEKREQMDKDAADAANKAYENAKNAEDEAQKQYSQAAYMSMNKVFGTVYTTNENGQELGQRVLSSETIPSYLRPIIDNLQAPVGLSRLAQLLDDRIVEEEIPVGGLAEDFMTKARDSSSWADLYNDLIQEDYREQLQNAIKGIDNGEVKDAYQWLYDQITKNLSEIGVIAEKGALNAKQSATEAARKTQISYKTQAQFSSKRLEADFHGGAPVDYLDDFSAFGAIVNGYIDTQFQKDAKNAGEQAPEWSKWWQNNTSKIDDYYTEIFKAGQELWASLSPEKQTKLNSLIASRSKYNETQFEKVLIEEFGLEKENPILTELLKYYSSVFNVDKFNDAIAKRQQARKGKQNQLDSVINQYQKKLEQLGGDELSQVLGQYDKLETKINAGAISESTGSNILQQYIESFLGQTEEVQALLADLDIFSFTDVMDLAHRLEGKEFKGKGLNVDSAIAALKQIAHLIPLNINTEAETLVSQVTEGLSDMESSIKHVTKGMDYKTMTEEAQKLGLETKDFQLTAGKYTPNDYAKVVNGMMADYNNQFADLITETNKRRNDVIRKISHQSEIASKAIGQSITVSPTANMLGITEDQLKIAQEDYNKYVKEAGKTAKDFVNWYFDSQIQTITDTSGQVKDYLTDAFAREALEAGQIETFASLAFGEEGKNIYDQYRNEILAAIGSGDISTLTSDAQSYLKQYEDLIISTYKDVQSSIANSMINAIKGGAADIQVTSNNLQALQQSDFIIKNEGQEFKIGDIAQIDIEKVKSSQTQFRTWLISIYNNESDQIKALQEYHEALYKNNTINNFTDLQKEGKVAYNDFTNYLVTNRKFSVAELVSGRLELEAANYGLSLNAAGEYIVTDWTKNINQLSADLLWLTTTNSNATVQDINAAKAALDNAKASQQKAITSSIENIVKDTSNISGDMIQSLADALGTSYQSIIDIIGINNQDGTYRLNTAGLSQLLNIKGISQATVEAIEESISSISDTYLSNIKNAASYMTKGASSLADVEAFRQSYADITGQVLDESAFQYNTLTQSFILDPAAMNKYVDVQKKLLTDMGYTEEFVNAYITDQTDKAIQASIELDSFLNANTSKQRNDEANKLLQQIRGLSNYQAIQKSLYVSQNGNIENENAIRNFGKLTEKEKDLMILRVLESGGQAAVDLLKQIKPDASSEELEAVFNSQINKLNDVMSQVGDLVAEQFVGTEGKLYQILRSADAVNNDGIVEAGFDMIKVYAAIYNEMTNTIGKTTAGLNDVYAQMWNATFADNNNIKELMSSAGGMAMDAFKDILSQYEVEVKNVINNNTRWGVNWDAFGNIIINDIDRFMEGLQSFGKGFVAPHKDSYEYQELRRSWADAMVEIQNRPLEIIDQITNEITQLSQAKNGQSFNISTLQHALGRTDAEMRGILLGYAATINDGILTINDASDVQGIMRVLAQEASEANVILTEDLQEIADAVSNLLQEIANIISNGISGKLSNVDAGKLTNWASEHGIDVDYTRTAEGLQLTAESAAQVYEEMKKIDPLLAKSLLPAIKDTKESYSTLTGTLMEFNDYNQQVAHKQDLANLKTLEHNLNKDSEQAWRQSNSKVKELYEKAEQARILGNGNVTLDQFARPKVISPDGGIMTYNSLSSGAKGGKEILVTPILPDGTVMSDNWAEEYASKMSAGKIELETKLVDENGKELNYQFKDIFMGAFDDIEAADKAAEAYHEYGAAVFEAAGAVDELTAKQKAMKNTLVDLIGNHMLDPDSMNFMSNKLPDYWQGPVNMWENAAQAMAALTEGGKKGYMGVQEFYNIITTASSLMEAAGQEFEVAGMNASELLQKGAENIKVVGGKAQIDLSGAGITVAGGVDQLKSNMADGVHELARAQIAILDAEIAVLEILAAMEQIGDLDVDMDGISFELGEIFANADDPFSEFTKDMTGWLNKLKSAIDKSEGAKELLQNFKINGKDIYSLLTSGAQEWRKAFGSNENIQKVLKQFTNTDWDLTGDLQTQVMDFIKNLDLGDFDTTFSYETPEMTIEFTPGGVKTIDWTTEDTQTVLNQIKEKFNDDEAAARKAIQDDIKAFSSGQTMENLTIEQVAQINGRIKATEGKTIFVDSEGNEIDSTDPGYAQALAEFAFEQNGIDLTNAKVEGEFLTTNVTVGTNTNIKVKTKISDKQGGIVWEYESADGIKGQGNTEAEMLDNFWRNYVDNYINENAGGYESAKQSMLASESLKQKVLYEEFGIRAVIKASITGKDGKVLDPSTDPGLRQQMQDIANTISGEDAQKLIKDGIVKNLGNGNLEIPVGKDGIKITVPGEAIDLDAKGNYDTAKLAEYIKTATGLDTIMAETISAGITDAFNKLPEIIGKVLDTINETDTKNLESTTTNIKNLASALSDLTKLTPDEFATKLALLAGEFNTLTSSSTLTTEALLALLEAIAAVDEALAALTGESKELNIDTSTLEGKLAKLKQELEELNNEKDKNNKTANEGEGTSQEGIGDKGNTSEQSSSQLSASNKNNKIAGVLSNVKAEVTSLKASPDISPVKVPIQADKDVQAKDVIVKATVEGDTSGIEDTIETTQNIETNGGVYDIPDFTTVQTIITVGSNSGTISGSSPQVPDGKGGYMNATGNIGLAKSKGTLMGELGPELVVSNGRYFVVGQNGPEMVNLKDDAIVFNHLQTEQLLKKGMSTERGHAVTNERNAVSFATGNVNGGLAMASASAALAQLKKLRAMWEGLLNASVSDLAGAGGGGGGGGGGGDDKVMSPKEWVETVERWYNLTQEIAKLEKQITHEEALRSKLQSDFQKNGHAYYTSQKESLKALRQQIAAQEELNLSRREYYDKRREALKDSPLGQIYTFDDEGQMKFRDDLDPKKFGGFTNAMEWYTDLVGFTENGKARYTNKQKYQRMIKAGFGKYMGYDEEGNKIKRSDYESEDEYYYALTKQAYDRIDEYQQATQSLWDEIQEGEIDILKLQEDANKLLEEMRDNQMEVENEVLKAIEDMKQREIDALQDERDALEESVGEFIDGLTEALNKERDMYEDQEAQAELNRNRRRLGILQRSGASASDIAALQSEINDQERDLYFDSQQRQIDAIQEASDKEIERLDNQIDLMTKQLEFQKEFGLLWGDVYQVMNQSAQQIADFIMNGNSEFWANSPLNSATLFEETLFKTQQWADYRDDADAMGMYANMMISQMMAGDYEKYDKAMKAEFGKDYDPEGKYKAAFEDEYRRSGDITKASEVGRKLYKEDAYKTEVAKRKEEAGDKWTGSKEYEYVPIDKTYHWTYHYVKETIDGVEDWYFKSKKKEKHTGKGTTCSKCGGKKKQSTSSSSSSGSSSGGNTSSSSSGSSSGNKTYWYTDSDGKTKAVQAKNADEAAIKTKSDVKTSKNDKAPVTKYEDAQKRKNEKEKNPKGAHGGYVGHGLYELGELGTETVFTAQQTRILRNNILSNRPNSLISLLKTYNEGFDQMGNPLTGVATSEDNSTNIDKVEVNMNIQQMSNDYDARRAGQEMMNEVLRIAKKTSAANSIRR